MKEYSVSIRAKNDDVFMEIISSLSKLDCEINVNKRDVIKPYVYNYSEVSYHKLGEKGCRSVDEYKRDVEMYNYLSGILKSFGINEKHIGFRYIIESVRLLNVYGVEKYTLDADVYPIIANWYETNTSSVEHNIRNSIVTAWNEATDENYKGKSRILCFDKRPTNLKFLKHISTLSICSLDNE